MLQKKHLTSYSYSDSSSLDELDFFGELLELFLEIDLDLSLLLIPDKEFGVLEFVFDDDVEDDDVDDDDDEDDTLCSINGTNAMGSS